MEFVVEANIVLQFVWILSTPPHFLQAIHGGAIMGFLSLQPKVGEYLNCDISRTFNDESAELFLHMMKEIMKIWQNCLVLEATVRRSGHLNMP